MNPLYTSSIYKTRCLWRHGIRSVKKQFSTYTGTVQFVAETAFVFLILGGFAFGIGYLKRNLPPSAEDEGFIESMVVAILIGGIVLAWFRATPSCGFIYRPPDDRYINLAPVSRRQIVHHWIWSIAAYPIIPVCVIAEVVAYVFPGYGFLRAVVSINMIGFLVSLHIACARVWKAGRRSERFAGPGPTQVDVLYFLRIGWFRFLVAFAAITAVATVYAYRDGYQTRPEWLCDIASWPVSWVFLYPFEVVVALPLRMAPTGFFLNVLQVGTIIALHYAVLIWLADRYEEIPQWRFSLRARPEQGRDKRGNRSRPRRTAIRLRETGPVVLAIAWKNTITSKRESHLIWVIVGAAILLAIPMLPFWATIPYESKNPVVFLLSAGILTYLGVLPLGNFGDLRRDYRYLPLLRALPLSGREILLGEILTPFVIIGTQAGFFLGLLTESLVLMKTVTLAEGIALLIVGLAAYLALVALWLLIENTVVIAFYASQDRPMGSSSPGNEQSHPVMLHLIKWIFLTGCLMFPAVIGFLTGRWGITRIGPEGWPAVLGMAVACFGACAAFEAVLAYRYVLAKLDSLDDAAEKLLSIGE